MRATPLAKAMTVTAMVTRSKWPMPTSSNQKPLKKTAAKASTRWAADPAARRPTLTSLRVSTYVTHAPGETDWRPARQARTHRAPHPSLQGPCVFGSPGPRGRSSRTRILTNRNPPRWRALTPLATALGVFEGNSRNRARTAKCRVRKWLPVGASKGIDEHTEKLHG